MMSQDCGRQAVDSEACNDKVFCQISKFFLPHLIKTKMATCDFT